MVTPYYSVLLFFSSFFFTGCGRAKQEIKPAASLAGKNISIILGSSRQKSISAQIGLQVQQLVKTELGGAAAIIDLAELKLPLLYESQPPAKRTVFPDALIEKWSETVATTDLFIMIVPEYNGGYPGIFKNALDLLYKEWHNKPVLLITHSGGPSGGADMAKHLDVVLRKFSLKVMPQVITLPLSWKLFTPEGAFAEKNNEQKIIDGLHDLQKAA